MKKFGTVIKRSHLWYRILPILAVLSLWFIAAKFEFVKPIFLPHPKDVYNSLSSLFLSEDGQKDIALTFYRVFVGFSFALILAIPLGIILGFYKRLYLIFEWPLDFLKSIPVSAMFPLFLIFFGFGSTSKIAMGAWASSLVILISTIHGVWGTKNQRKIMALTKKAKAHQIISKIIIFESLPHIFSGIRIGVSWNLIVVVVAEMFIGTRHGLGDYIYESSILFDTAGVFAGLIVIGSIGYLLNILILNFERKIVHWNDI